MKVRTLIACMLAASVSLHALDLSPAGFTAGGTSQVGGQTVASFQDPRGRTVEVFYAAEPSDAVVSQLITEWGIIDSFRTIVAQSLRITIDDGVIAILVTPSRLTVEGTDILPTVPAGLYFSYTEFLEYDFRMTVENLFLRIRGVYRSEDELVQRMVSALKDPRSVLQASDPAYFYAKIDQLERSLALLDIKVDELNASLASLGDAHRQLSDSHAELSMKYDALEAEGTEIVRQNQAEHQGLSASVDSLAASVDSLGRKDEELAQADRDLAQADRDLAQADRDLAQADASLAIRTGELAAASSEAASEFEALRHATLYFQNIEWLFFHKEIPRDGIARIVELKEANPVITLKELSAQLKSEGIKITDRAIKLVLQAYYNEF